MENDGNDMEWRMGWPHSSPRGGAAMTRFRTLVQTLLVLPVDEPLYSERGTQITLVDEGGGLFVEIEQTGALDKVGKVTLDADEWPAVKRAIDQQIAVCRAMNKKKETQLFVKEPSNARQ
jgi:hypothetical protein